MSVCKINECGSESIVLFDWTKLNTSVKNSDISFYYYTDING